MADNICTFGFTSLAPCHAPRLSKKFFFDATGQYTSQQHVNKMTDYFELHEIDESDVQMRLFAQTLTGDVKKWFKAFPANHIADLAAFHRLFIDRRERKPSTNTI